MCYSMTPRLSKLLTPCDYYSYQPGPGIFVGTYKRIPLEEIIALLVREGAHTINVPLAFNGGTENFYDSVNSQTARRRIMPVYLNSKLAFQIKDYLQPVADWILSNMKKGTLQAEHLVNSLYYVAHFLYCFKLGINEQAQVDARVPKIKGSLKVLTANITDAEARLRLEQVTGILGSYNGTSINTFIYAGEERGVSMIDKIDDLLDEAELIELSKKRHSLGIPRISTEAQLAWLKSKLWYREVLRKKTYRDYLRLSNEIIFYISKHLGREFPKLEVPLLTTNSYKPPLIDVSRFVREELSKKYQKPVAVRYSWGPWMDDDLRKFVVP